MQMRNLLAALIPALFLTAPASAEFLSPDPVGFTEGGPGYFNRYAYAFNDPVNFVGPTGMCGAEHENKDVCVYAIPGAGGEGSGSNSTLKGIVEQYGGVFEDIGADGAAASIAAYMEANPEAQVVLLGYSRGGGEAVSTANILGDSGVNVDALVTFDAHRLVGNSFQLTGNNVQTAVNFYQRNSSTGRFGLPIGDNPYRGRPLTGAPAPGGSITNYNLTGVRPAPRAGSRYVHNRFIRQVQREEALNQAIQATLP